MNISVYGLGYVGVVSASCLASEGHSVIGVDPNVEKVAMLNDGRSPIIEQGLEKLITDAVTEGRLSATADDEHALLATDLSIVCVGTPSNQNGSLDYQYIESVCHDIGRGLAKKESYHTVVVRSTVLPGSMRGLIIPLIEKASGKKAGLDFGVCNNPEFLREGTAVFDYFNPPKTIIGEITPGAGDELAELYAKIDAPMIRTKLEVAEIAKYVDNVWHATKVAFANEIGSICKPLGIDSHEVMDIFVQDTKLNLSAYYMKPGFAFGDSCLPKDVRALAYKANHLDLQLPLLTSILPSNQEHLQRCIDLIAASSAQRIGILGLSFKSGTDDLRESPSVDLIEYLIGKGKDVKIYDRNVSLAALIGANRDYILNAIPHISNLLVDSIDEVFDHAEVVVIANNSEEFQTAVQRTGGDQLVVDLVRLPNAQTHCHSSYSGICW